MASDYDPAGLNDVKKKIFEQIDPVLNEQGFDKSRWGSETPLRDFDSDSGFWGVSTRNKVPRCLFHLVQDGGDWVAKIPDEKFGNRVACANLASRDNVAALGFRLLPVVKQAGGQWTPYEQWEWLGVIFLPEPVQGHGAQPIDGFTPPNFDLECGGRKLNPISIHVYALCDPGSTCSAVPDDVTYAEATNALRQLFGVTAAEGEDSSDEE